MTLSRILFFFSLILVPLLGCDGASIDPPPAQVEEKQFYSCGMHPQVVQDHPGSCPICSMDLTPMKSNASASGASPGDRVIAHWRAPMDPTFVQDKPGKSPMGMDLIPVYEDELLAKGKIVNIAPGIIQQMGVRTLPVKRQTVFRHVRTIGEVEVGEDEISVVNLRFSGWAEKILADKTGGEVKRGQPLFTIYSPELVAAQEELLLANSRQGPNNATAKSSRKKLELWGIADRDIDQVITTGEASRTMVIRAPRSGFILHKNLVEGARVNAGKDLYRIGNLKRIWVTAEVYEHDAPWVEVGQPAQLEVTHLSDETIQGQVSYIYPELNPKSRTLTVRLEFDNPGIKLKPGMFATVYIQYRRKDDSIAIPSQAILHSGRKKLVFISYGQGRFEAREISTGLKGDDHLTEVTQGLSEGDVIALSGQFLIDSESQLQEALQKILAANDGVSHTDHEHNVQAHHIWSCPMHPDIISKQTGKCSECGMNLEQRVGTSDELKLLNTVDGAYQCPMHPEVVSDSPGRCTVCGMFLESVESDK